VHQTKKKKAVSLLHPFAQAAKAGPSSPNRFAPLQSDTDEDASKMDIDGSSDDGVDEEAIGSDDEDLDEEEEDEEEMDTSEEDDDDVQILETPKQQPDQQDARIDARIAQFEKPTPRAVQYSPEFKEWLKVSGACSTCYSAKPAHNDARSTKCLANPTKVRAKAKSFGVPVNKDTRDEAKAQICAEARLKAATKFLASTDPEARKRVKALTLRFIRDGLLDRRESLESDSELDVPEDEVSQTTAAAKPTPPPTGKDVNQELMAAAAAAAAAEGGRTTPTRKGKNVTPASQTLLQVQGDTITVRLDCNMLSVGYVNPQDGFLPTFQKQVSATLDTIQEVLAAPIKVLPWYDKDDDDLPALTSPLEKPRFAKVVPKTEYALKTYTSQVRTTIPEPKKRAYYNLRLVVPKMDLSRLFAKIDEPLARSEACGKPYISLSKIQSATNVSSPYWLCGTTREMDLSYLVPSLQELVGGDVELALGVGLVRDPTSIPKDMPSGFRSRVYAIHIYCDRRLEDEMIEAIPTAWKGKGRKLGFGQKKFILVPTWPNGAQEQEFAATLLGKQRSVDASIQSKHIPSLLDIDSPLNSTGATLRKIIMEKKVTTTGPDGKERNEDLFMAVEPVRNRDRTLKLGFSVFFHASLANKANAFVGEIIPRTIGTYGEDAAKCFRPRSVAMAAQEYTYCRKTDKVTSKMATEQAALLEEGAWAQFDTITTQDLIQRQREETEAEQRKVSSDATKDPVDERATAWARDDVNFGDDSSLPSLTKIKEGASVGARRPYPADLLGRFNANDDDADSLSSRSLGSKSKAELKASAKKIAALEAVVAQLQMRQDQPVPPVIANQADSDASISSMESMTSKATRDGDGQEEGHASDSNALQPGGGTANMAVPQHPQMAASEGTAARSGYAGGGYPTGGAE